MDYRLHRRRASYLPLWLSHAQSNAIIWITLCALAGCVAFLLSDASMTITLVAVVAGADTLNGLNILKDVAADPTSHNLFPFEVVFTLLLTVIGAAIGVGLARLAKYSIASRRPGK